MENIVGHEKQKKILNLQFNTNKVYPAYLFYGPSMIGKKSLAIEFAKLMGAFSPSDLMIIDFNPYINNPVTFKEFKIAKNKFYLKPFNSQYKFVIFDNFEYSLDVIQNSLLKILEEPPSQTIFLLISQSSFIAPTLLSRLFLIKFSPVNDDLIKDMLKKEDPKLDESVIQKIVLLAGGKPALAKILFQNQIFFQRQNIFLGNIENILSSSLFKRRNFFQKYFEDIEDKFSLVLYFDILLNSLRRKILSNIYNENLQKANFLIKEAQFILKAKSFIINDQGTSLKLIIDALAFSTIK